MEKHNHFISSESAFRYHTVENDPSEKKKKEKTTPSKLVTRVLHAAIALFGFLIYSPAGAATLLDTWPCDGRPCGEAGPRQLVVGEIM